MKCPRCGNENDEGFRFCGNCGVPLEPPEPQDRKTAQANFIGAQPSSVLHWELPTAAILDASSRPSIDESELIHRVRIIESTLAQFGTPGKVVEINSGPRITQYGIALTFKGRTRTRVNQIIALRKDLELALAAGPIQLETPIPGRSIIGIDVPNTKMESVPLGAVLLKVQVRPTKLVTLTIALGLDTIGEPLTADLRTLPHVLIAGSTGSGKSVCMTAIIASLLLHHSPNSVRMVMADPKRVDLMPFTGIPHLIAPIIFTMDDLITSLRWLIREMKDRYRIFSKSGMRNINDYQLRIPSSLANTLPFIVVLIDEIAGFDVLPTSEIEELLSQLLQDGHNAGLHIVLSTQRPSAKVISGLVKSKFLSRISFAVTSVTDSSIVLDCAGAEKLLRPGDMLFKDRTASRPQRAQGCLASDGEIARLVYFWHGQTLTHSGLISDDPQRTT